MDGADGVDAADRAKWAMEALSFGDGRLHAVLSPESTTLRKRSSHFLIGLVK